MAAIVLQKSPVHSVMSVLPIIGTKIKSYTIGASYSSISTSDKYTPISIFEICQYISPIYFCFYIQYLMVWIIYSSFWFIFWCISIRLPYQFSLDHRPYIPSFCFIDKGIGETCAWLPPHWAYGEFLLAPIPISALWIYQAAFNCSFLTFPKTCEPTPKS